MALSRLPYFKAVRCLSNFQPIFTEALVKLTSSKVENNTVFDLTHRSIGVSQWRNHCTTPFKFQFSKKEEFLAKSKLITMKLDSPQFHALFTPELKVLIDVFKKYDYELRIAGGAVRDLVLGKNCHDVDFATTATPSEMKEMFDKEAIRMLNMKGEQHGTITCRINDKENFEVTTLRIDVVTDGRHAEVEFTKNWQLDALRRDLTINSMFLDFDGVVYDHFDGLKDLQARRIHFVGNPADRITEDYLRILRYFRFYGRIAEEPSTHEEETLKAIKDHMHGLGGISGERIWVELKKILVGNHASSIVRVMMELGMAKFVGLPENPNVTEFEQVWKRCCKLNPQPMSVLASLMCNEEEVYALNSRLKMSKDELRTGVFVVNHRDDLFGPDKLRFCQDLMCDIVGKEPKTKDKIYELLKYRGDEETLVKFQSWNLPRFPVNGHRLLEMGIKKGPALAKMLNELRIKWKETGFTYTEEQLLEFVEELKHKVQ